MIDNSNYFEDTEVKQLTSDEHESKLLKIHTAVVDSFKSKLLKDTVNNINNDQTLQQYLSKYHEDQHYLNSTERAGLYSRYIDHIKSEEEYWRVARQTTKTNSPKIMQPRRTNLFH